MQELLVFLSVPFSLFFFCSQSYIWFLLSLNLSSLHNLPSHFVNRDNLWIEITSKCFKNIFQAFALMWSCELFFFLSFFLCVCVCVEVSVSREIEPGVKKGLDCPLFLGLFCWWQLWIPDHWRNCRYGLADPKVAGRKEDSSIQNPALGVPERNRIRGRREKEQLSSENRASLAAEDFWGERIRTLVF